MADIIQIMQEDNGKLSKKQAEFHRLNIQIKNLSDTIDLMQKEIPKFHERVSREVEPLIEKIVLLRKETIRMGEQMLSNHFTKKKERETLIEILLELMDSLPNMDEEVIELYNKVTNGNFEEDVKEMQMAEFLQTKKRFESMSGEKIDPEIDTLEKLVEFMKFRAAQMHEEQEELRRRIAEKKQEAKGTRPKTARQLEKERIAAEKKAKKEAEARVASKSVRELYMELAKTFHPDLEPDENEKVRKTAIMQRLTAAYEESNLLALFQIQLELECLAPEVLTDLSEEKLNAFVRVLKGQKRTLQYELAFMLGNVTQLLQQRITLSTMEHQFDQYIKSCKRSAKKRIKDSEELLAIFSNPNTLRAWMK